MAPSTWPATNKKKEKEEWREGGKREEKRRVKSKAEVELASV